MESNDIAIQVEGHPARITRLLPRHDDLRDQDDFVAVVEFQEPVDGVLTTGVRLPVKRYTKQEFVAAVTQGAARELAAHREFRRREQAQLQRELQLHALAAEVSRELGLGPPEA